MATVTVDSDDLEALLFATGVITTIEAAVKQRKDDAQWLAAKPKIAAAAHRLGNAMRGATRRETMPHLFKDPTEDEIAQLIDLDNGGARRPEGIEIGIGLILGKTKANPDSLRPLMAANLVEFGTHQERVLWGSSGNNWSSESAEPRCRLTVRGIEIVREARARKAGLHLTVDETES